MVHLHRVISIFLTVVHIAMGGVLPLVVCNGRDGHVQVEYANRACSESSDKESDVIQHGALTPESRSCKDTPIRPADTRASRTVEVLDDFALALYFEVVRVSFIDDHNEILTDPCSMVVFTPSDAALRVLRTVVLTV